MNKRETNAAALTICIFGLVACYVIEAAKRNAVPFRLFVGLAVLLAAAAALYLALICAAEWLAGRAINRHMDDMGKDRMERELKGASPYNSGTVSYAAGAASGQCPYRRPSNKRAWRAGWLSARRGELARRKTERRAR